MKHTRRRFIKIGGVTTLASLSGVAFGFSGCNETTVDKDNALRINGVSIPSAIDVEEGQSIAIAGKGFELGDQMLLTGSDDTVYTSVVTTIADGQVSFAAPAGIPSGVYTLSVVRNGERLSLGKVFLNVVATVDLPDVSGMTVKGVVYSDGKGVAGVVVSDGYEVTTTDSKGRYYLPSQKKTGFVFIAVPGNYEVANDGNAPQFFKRLKAGDAVERQDFSLVKTVNDKHVVITMADWHLANRNNDLAQFTSKVLPDVNATIDQYAADGTKVYVLTLGDLSWELYWHENQFGLNEYIPYMNKLKAPVFNLMGNHDNDPYSADDWQASKQYRDIIGPSYYSFNLGKVHYVVLDDVEYVNKGASAGVVGDRSYHDKVHSDQLAWLKKDLATITDKSTPIVLATHIPLYQNPTLDASGNPVNGYDLSNGAALVDCFKEFSTVHVLTGHTHINYTVEKERTLMEHNTAAICATWWWTGRNGYANNHICRDGSPGGYGVWKMNGREMQWLYKSIGYAEDYQFRAYDLNTTYITASGFAPNATDAALATYAGPYAQKQSGNEVLINIWGYDSQWKVEVMENGRKLDVTRVQALDPLHIVSYEALRLNAGATPTAAFVSTRTAHMFKATAAAANSTLEIVVTDRFGKVSRESMVRPKAFGLQMR